MKFFKYTYILGIIAVAFSSCTEPYKIEESTFEELLVVEANLTDSLQYQTVFLSRSYPITANQVSYESNAQVWLERNDGVTYNYVQQDTVYVSTEAFQAEQGSSYTLHVVTSNGEEYISSQEETPQEINIESLYTEIAVDENGNEGVQIYADVVGSSSETLYTRATYQETYKIVTPYILYADTELTNLVNNCYVSNGCSSVCYDIELTNLDNPVNICYPTLSSNEIILQSSASLNQPMIERVPLKFINKEDYMLREGYSFLAQMYSQSYDVFQYYVTTAKLNSDGDVLSPVQPGFINGNMRSVADASTRVVGYFQVNTQATKRIFFDFADFGFPEPAYFSECDVQFWDYNSTCPPPGTPPPPDQRVMLYQAISFYNYKVLSHTPGSSEYQIVNPECSDCRMYGTTTMPDFWEE